jgi:hypothetical protein
MNIDVVVAKLIKRGMVESNAKRFAAKLLEEANIYGVDLSVLFEDIQNASLSQLGDFLSNNIGVKGFITGKAPRKSSSDIVSRTIIK